jgi:pimeloyl-ACP methyl ester carboxylesterase
MERAVSDGPHVGFEFPYDWRYDLTKAAADLANVLANAATVDQWAVVCHSAGAMVMLLAWAALPPWAKAKCRRVVWVDPCIGGSYDAMRGLAGGYFGLYGFGRLSAVLSTVVFKLNFPLQTSAAQQDRLNHAVASWPSLYQLLPNPGGPWVGLDANLQGTYTATRWANSNNQIQQQWLNLAATTQAAVILAAAAPLPPSVKVTGEPDVTTTKLLSATGPLWDYNNYQADMEGDGVIPFVRMDLEGVPTLKLQGKHQEIIGAAQLTSRILDLIDNGLPVSTDVPPPAQIVGPKTLVPPNTPGVFIPGPFVQTGMGVDP